MTKVKSKAFIKRLKSRTKKKKRRNELQGNTGYR